MEGTEWRGEVGFERAGVGDLGDMGCPGVD